MKPLEGITVLDFSQYLSGPSAALRLADLGAKVIKIEMPEKGDSARKLIFKNITFGEDSIIFHTVNRNKESFAANLKDEKDVAMVRKLIKQADVLIENFRPGTMKRLGLDYEKVKQLNPQMVYGSVTGYGKSNTWRHKPGQDLLVQALSGLSWLNGNRDQPPLPFPLAVADMFAGAHLAQGILAGLVRRGKNQEGSLVEVSLLESILDLQFEVLTAYLNDGGQKPERSLINNAHTHLSAPYGIYETKDGYIALAMGSIGQLADLLECPELNEYSDSNTWFEARDDIKMILMKHLKTKRTNDWLNILEPADYWCAEVLNWDKLFAHQGFMELDMVQEVDLPDGGTFKTLRCPITINGERLKSSKSAPLVGQDNEHLAQSFNL